MKKILFAILVCMSLGLVGCGGNDLEAMTKKELKSIAKEKDIIFNAVDKIDDNMSLTEMADIESNLGKAKSGIDDKLESMNTKVGVSSSQLLIKTAEEMISYYGYGEQYSKDILRMFVSSITSYYSGNYGEDENKFLSEEEKENLIKK